MPKIVTLTLNPAVDKSSSVTSVSAEIKLRCAKPDFHPGGGGINSSRAIQKLGGESLAVFTAGGGSGEMLIHLLDEENIAQHPIRTEDFTRENLTIYEEATGLQYRFGMPGPVLTEDELQQCFDAIFALDAEYIIASGSLPVGVPNDFYAQVTKRGAETGVKVIVDTSGTALRALEGAGAFLLKPNLSEIEQIFGVQFKSEAQMIRLARREIDKGTVQVVVVSMGSSGALFVSADEAAILRPPTVPIQSKVGAGDSMVGGIVLALSQGKSLLESARYGVAAGSAAVMTPGTLLCRKDDTEDIYQRVDILPR